MATTPPTLIAVPAGIPLHGTEPYQTSAAAQQPPVHRVPEQEACLMPSDNQPTVLPPIPDSATSDAGGYVSQHSISMSAPSSSQIIPPLIQDGSSATGKFGALGGKLATKRHGFTLHIPPGALEEDETISLQVLTEIPNGLKLKQDERLVSHGYQCYPSGLRFKKPAKLIIPHCALVTAPNKVQTILYSWNQSGTPKRISDPDINCSVQERWLEISISHFSGGFISLMFDWLFMKGELLSCMPFLPTLMPPSRKPILEVRFVKKPHGEEWNDVHDISNSRFQHVKGDDDEIVLQRGTFTVACQLGENSLRSNVEAVENRDMRTNTRMTVYFELDLTEESDETMVTLEVVQTSTQTIKFITRFQGYEATTEQNAPSPSIDEIPSDKQRVTDADILNLARLLPPNLWGPLHVALRIDYSTAEGIREKFRDTTEQYVHLLQTWKATSTRTRKDLNATLIQAEAGGFVDKYLDYRPFHDKMDAITDAELFDLAVNVPSADYHNLGVKLGEEPRRLNEILDSKNNDYRRSTVAILMSWMATALGESWRTKRSRLGAILSSLKIDTSATLLPDQAEGSTKGSGSVEKQVDTEASVHTTDPEHQNIGSASSEQVVQDVIRDSIGASDQQSGSIRIDKYGIEVQFHPSEIWSVDDIQAVPEVPAELVNLLTEDQAIICVGLKASPSDAKFKYPVKVTMPHSAIFKRPDAASIGTYHRKSSSDSFSLIAFASGDPRCDVRERDLDLYISHFSEWWIFAFITKLFVGKRVICTPFVPEPSPKNAKHLLRLCIRDSNRGTAEPESGYVTGIKGEEYFVAWRSGDLRVTCQVDDGDIDTKTRRITLFRTSCEVNVPFVVNTSAADTSKVFVQFTLEQSAKIEIICPMNLSGDEMTPREHRAQRPTDSPEVLTDVHLLRISKGLSPDNFLDLYVALGIQSSTATCILKKKANDYTQTYMELLQQWKKKSHRTLADLDKVLVESEAGGLISMYKQEPH